MPPRWGVRWSSVRAPSQSDPIDGPQTAAAGDVWGKVGSTNEVIDRVSSHGRRATTRRAGSSGLVGTQALLPATIARARFLFVWIAPKLQLVQLLTSKACGRTFIMVDQAA